MYVGMAMIDGVVGKVRVAEHVRTCQERVMADFCTRVDGDPEDCDYLFVAEIDAIEGETKRWVFFTDTQLWTEV